MGVTTYPFAEKYEKILRILRKIPIIWSSAVTFTSIMYNLPDIGLVNSHTKSHCCHDNLYHIIDKLFMGLATSFWGHSSMVGMARNPHTYKQE